MSGVTAVGLDGQAVLDKHFNRVKAYAGVRVEIIKDPKKREALKELLIKKRVLVRLLNETEATERDLIASTVAAGAVSRGLQRGFRLR